MMLRSVLAAAASPPVIEPAGHDYDRHAGLQHLRGHFMATTMLTAGVPVSVVAGRPGHARSATTLNIYSHFVESGDQAAADLLAGLFDGNRKSGVGQKLDSAVRKTKEAGPVDPA